MLLYAAFMGGGYRAIEKGSMKIVFLFQHFLNVSIISIKPILVLANGGAITSVAGA